MYAGSRRRYRGPGPTLHRGLAAPGGSASSPMAPTLATFLVSEPGFVADVATAPVQRLGERAGSAHHKRPGADLRAIPRRGALPKPGPHVPPIATPPQPVPMPGKAPRPAHPHMRPLRPCTQHLPTPEDLHVVVRRLRNGRPAQHRRRAHPRAGRRRQQPRPRPDHHTPRCGVPRLIRRGHRIRVRRSVAQMGVGIAPGPGPRRQHARRRPPQPRTPHHLQRRQRSQPRRRPPMERRTLVPWNRGERERRRGRVVTDCRGVA